MNTALKPRDECLYYLVREMYGLGPKASSAYFDGILEHIQREGTAGMRGIELAAVAEAARIRDRLSELAEAAERWRETQTVTG